jgi:assimilatory nitrate reductase catalytic subunit
VGSGTVFAAMHWNGQFLSSGGINEVSLPAVDARSRQPELKHAAVRVERADFGWHLLAARRGDALAMRAAVQPLLNACGYAALSLQAETGAPDGVAWLVLSAASATAFPPSWLAALASALALVPCAGTLEYHDARRGLLRRVAWREQAQENFIDGLQWIDTQPPSQASSLLAMAVMGQAWQGSRLSAFAGTSLGARDPIVCVCRQVGESAIRARVAAGADVADLKQELGCGTVCGSCLPQLHRLAAVPARA